MSDSDSPLYPGLRPPAHYLMLFARAAVLDDGHGGPWLTVQKIQTPAGTPIFTHHISVRPVDYYSLNRLVMLTGAEALHHIVARGWADITDPSVAEVRALGTYAVELHGADRWEADYRGWLADYCGPAMREAREQHTDTAAGQARALRWTLAEQWLRQTPEA